MAGNIQVPANIEDKTVLKRFLTDLVLGIGANPFYSGNVQAQNEAIVQALKANPNLDFMNLVSKINELSNNIKTYIEDEIETVILQNKEDIAVVAEQFATFYDQALAASWYGLTVKAGGAVAGLEVGSLDPNVTTPGDESSYFRIIADNFAIGKAYEDLTAAEKAYLSSNGLPNFGTVYNTTTKKPIPAVAITWDSVANTYRHYFNGIVNFVNVSGVPTINKTWIQATAPTGATAGDTWLNTVAGYASFNYNGNLWVATGNKTFIQSTMPVGCISGDIWVNNANNNSTSRYDGYSWTNTTIDAALAVNNGSTTINGGMITAYSIDATKLSVSYLSAITANLGTVTAGVIYDSSWNGTSYKMKIDLNNGRIYIK